MEDQNSNNSVLVSGRTGLSAGASCKEPGEAFVGAQPSPSSHSTGLPACPPVLEVSRAGRCQAFEDAECTLGGSPLCLLPGEDLIFLDLLSDCFFICFSVSKSILPSSPCCAPIIVGVLFGGWAFKLTGNKPN